MNEQELALFKEKLAQRLQEIQAKSISMQDSAKPVELDQTRMGRLSRVDAIQSQAMARDAAQDNEDQKERVAVALQKIEQGTYGVCERCGETIPQGRLEFDLAAEYCVQCAGQINRR